MSVTVKEVALTRRDLTMVRLHPPAFHTNPRTDFRCALCALDRLSCTLDRLSCTRCLVELSSSALCNLVPSRGAERQTKRGQMPRLDHFRNLQTLDVSHNQLRDLGVVPPSLRSVHCKLSRPSPRRLYTYISSRHSNFRSFDNTSQGKTRV
eukprot:1998023-Rhodomonas_salina.2